MPGAAGEAMSALLGLAWNVSRRSSATAGRSTSDPSALNMARKNLAAWLRMTSCFEGLIMESADVVIIGGGIVGSSIAYHLAEAGCKNVLVLERESRQGVGSTGKSMGGVRAQFATTVNIQMSLYSIPFYASFDERLGEPAGYRPQGYLFLATNEKHIAYLKGNQERQKGLGLNGAEMVSAEEIRKDFPQLKADDVLGGSFCPTDGFVDPHSAMSGFMMAASARGARLWKAAAVTAIDRDERGVSGVQTLRGPVKTRVLVNAAGPWAAEIGKLAGVEIPITPTKRMLVPTEPFADFPHSAPMIIDMSNGFHFRPESLGFLLAWNDPKEKHGFNTDFEVDFIEKILLRAAERVPCFENLAVNPKKAWAGLYEVTPDHHCILGPVPEVPGLFLANGFSGHGVMHAPATGRILADLIVQGTTGVIDAHTVRLGRFKDGEMIHETAVL
jgi:sarcosine oxidase subunit beta